MRPSKESAELDERPRNDEENDQGGDGQGGKEQSESDADVFAAEDLPKKLEKALGGRTSTTPMPRRQSSGVSVLSIRLNKK